MINLYSYVYQSLDNKKLRILSLKGNLVELKTQEAETVRKIILPLLQDKKLMRTSFHQASNCVLEYAGLRGGQIIILQGRVL